MCDTIDKRPEIGTVVRLKSGGPPMVVTAHPKKEENVHFMVMCRWFDKQWVAHRESFPQCVLELCLANHPYRESEAVSS